MTKGSSSDKKENDSKRKPVTSVVKKEEQKMYFHGLLYSTSQSVHAGMPLVPLCNVLSA